MYFIKNNLNLNNVEFLVWQTKVLFYTIKIIKQFHLHIKPAKKQKYMLVVLKYKLLR